jgi:hypothetical protein
MKQVFFSTAIAFAFLFSTTTPVVASTPQVEAVQDNKELTALPEAIKTALATEENKDFKAETAVLVKGEKAIYEIEGKKGEVVTVLKFDEAGVAIK